ncbi:hypothetical protein I656_01280 [Geobacillus sp. WSUCF1]|nr:hypothetical protein I656_01280 [Geobacillus sp. WSUCF1]
MDIFILKQRLPFDNYFYRKLAASSPNQRSQPSVRLTAIGKGAPPLCKTPF